MPSATLDEIGVVLSCPQCGQRNRLRYNLLDHRTRCGACKAPGLALDTAIEIERETLFDLLLLKSNLPVLVDFWAPWCGPCKMVAPEMVKVAKAGAGRFVVAKLNTDDFPAMAAKHSISSLPTLGIFQAGREVQRSSGARPASEILRLLSDTLGI
jgi:thioredoxin 2